MDIPNTMFIEIVEEIGNVFESVTNPPKDANMQSLLELIASR